MKKKLILALFIFISFFVNAESKDFGSYEKLDGKWEFFLQKTPEQVLDCIKKGQVCDCFISVPEFWNDSIERLTGENNPNTYGCYRYVLKGQDFKKKYALLIKDSPPTACAVYVNGKNLVQNGEPHKIVESGKHKNSYSVEKPMYCEFYPDKNGEVEIIVFIVNDFYRKSGLWDHVLFGSAKQLYHSNVVLLTFYAVITGILIFLGLLNEIQFVINRKRTEHLFLGIAAIVLALRISTAGYCSLACAIPVLTAGIKIKMEYLALWLAPVVVLNLLTVLYPVKNEYILFNCFEEKYLRYSFISAGCFVGILSLILPPVYSNRLVPVMQSFLVVFCLYVIVLIVLNVIRKSKYIVYYLISCGFLVAGAFSDTIYSRYRTFVPFPFLPFFVVFFIFSQILLITVIQNDIYKSTAEITKNLKSLNEAYLRFVPQEFLKLLNKDSIVNIKLGDFANIKMAIMFAKINIQTADEKSVEEHFLIFNDYLRLISPVVETHNGFVTKFLSGGFMVLFPKAQKDSLFCAVEIQEVCKELNRQYAEKNCSVMTWIGIHYGNMIIGTIGEENRLDDTVISDTVNTSARIEGVCEKLGRNIIISHSLYESIDSAELENIKINELDAISVKGKKKPLQLYECLGKRG